MRFVNMKIPAFLLFIVFSLVCFPSCSLRRSNTDIIVFKNMPYPEKRSYYTLWSNESREFKESIVTTLDSEMISESDFAPDIQAEWLKMTFSEKDESIQDFFFRRKDTLFCRSYSDKPYKNYMSAYFVGDFRSEFTEITMMSPKYKKQAERRSLLPEPAEKTAAKQPPGTPKEQSGKTKPSTYYDKVIEDSGLGNSTGKETLISDVTQKATAPGQ
jgi:hypothetical protein